MSVPIQVTCGECWTAFATEKPPKDGVFVCPACGHSHEQKPLPEDEQKMLKSTFWRQLIFSILAVGCLVGAMVCLLMWNFQDPAAPDADSPVLGMVAAGLGLAAVVCGVLASLRRFVYEF